MLVGLHVTRILSAYVVCISLCIGLIIPYCEAASDTGTAGSIVIAMELLRSAWAKLKGVWGHRGEDMPRYTFPDTLEEFGYHFNEKGELVNKDGGGFQFVVKEGDRNYNQQHYDALGELVTEYLYNMMEKELQLEKIYIPLDAKREEPQSFIFKSKDALVSDKLMVLIHGSGAVRAGQWSRKLIINENIDTGSQLPYIRRAMDDGYGVIVLNPNLNEVTVNGRPVKIRESKSPEEHGVNVWQHFVLTAKARNIVIVAHSYGGIVTCHMAEKFLEDFLKRVFCVVFTDSVHSADRGRWSQAVKDFMKERAVNFASAYVPLDTMLDASSPDDCLSVSAGTKEHERTSHACIDSAFKFIRDNFDTWSKDGSMAPRTNFLPLPDNLEDFSPARQWEAKVKKEEDEKMIKEEDENMKKEEEAAKNGEEESESKNGGAPGSGQDPRDTQENLKNGENDRDIKAEEDQAKQPAKESSEAGQGEGNAEGEKAESTSSQQGNESTASQNKEESTESSEGGKGEGNAEGEKAESTSSQQGNKSTASQNKEESTQGEQYTGEQKAESAAGEPVKKNTEDEEKQKQPEVPKSEL